MQDRISRFKNFHLNFIPPHIMRSLAVRKLAAGDMAFPEVTFKVAESESEMSAAFSLLQDSYIRRGIAKKGTLRLRVINLLPSTTTFVAKSGGEVIGTISLIEDSELGLPMEKVHQAEVDQVRTMFRHIAEVGALAVKPEYRRSGLSIMLYNMMYRWARNWRRVDDLLISIHPTAKFFYRNILQFRVVGPIQQYEGLGGAASLPLRLDIPGVQLKFHKMYKNSIIDHSRQLNLYEFFCGPTDRFDFSSHPEFKTRKDVVGPLHDVAVSQLLQRFSDPSEALGEVEAKALRRHFPDISIKMEGAA